MDTTTEPAAPTTPADPIQNWLQTTNQARTEFSIGYIRAALAKPEMIDACRKTAATEWQKQQNEARRLIRDSDDSCRGEELEAKARPAWHPLVRAGEILADEARAISTGIVASLFPMPELPARVANPDPVDQPAEASVA